jgi:hypothetical protein
MSSGHHFRVSHVVLVSINWGGRNCSSFRASSVFVPSTPDSEGRRGGKSIATKAIVDAALKECPLVEKVLVLARTGAQVPMQKDRDFWWHEEIQKVPAYCSPEIMNSEDPLFILYVSRVGPGPRGEGETWS